MKNDEKLKGFDKRFEEKKYRFLIKSRNPKNKYAVALLIDKEMEKLHYEIYDLTNEEHKNLMIELISKKFEPISLEENKTGIIFNVPTFNGLHDYEFGVEFIKNELPKIIDRGISKINVKDDLKNNNELIK